jgi:hypothetical protein
LLLFMLASHVSVFLSFDNWVIMLSHY